MKTDTLDLITGAKIAHYRAIKGLTQTQLAEKANLSTSYISHLEKGLRTATFKAIVKIANALEIDWKEIGISPITKRIEGLDISIEEKEELNSIVNKASILLGRNI